MESKPIDYERLAPQAFGVTIIVFVLLCYTIFIRKDEIIGILINPNQFNSTHGIIVSSDLERRYTRRRTVWHYEITYTYSVTGKDFVSDQITFAYTGSSDKEFAEEYVRKYPVGKTVIVYYLPESPGFSVLEPSVKSLSIIYIMVGWGLGGMLSLMIALISLKNRILLPPKNV